MEDVYSGFESDKDALHILPLNMIPLRTAALRQARLIKNARLEGVVELFSGRDTGSGQIRPHQLRKAFEFPGENAGDIQVIKSLSKLPSYDVYSLRIELRRLGIEVDEQSYLQLSGEKSRELTQYMMVFTRPLIRFIYGNQKTNVSEFRDLIGLFASPDIKNAQANLLDLARRLEIDLTDLPAFLEDYGDVYLSLSYYQYCLDQNMARLTEFFDAIEEIRCNSQLGSDLMIARTCNEIDGKLKNVVSEVNDVLEMFRATTMEMWENVSASEFGTIKKLIESYQSRVGGALCAVTVKMGAWSERFPEPEKFGIARKANFIVNEMQQGMNLIRPIRYPAVA